jgi:hypothetical protein
MLRPGSVIDAHICGPSRLDGKNLQIICHLSGRRIDDSMVKGAMLCAIALDHRFKEDPNRIRWPLAYHGGYALIVSMTEPGKEITEWRALGADGAVPGSRQVGRETHCPDCIGHLVENRTTILG